MARLCNGNGTVCKQKNKNCINNRNISSVIWTICATRDSMSVRLGKSYILLSASAANCTMHIIFDDTRFMWSEEETLGCGALCHGIFVTKVKSSQCSVLVRSPAIPRPFLSTVQLTLLKPLSHRGLVLTSCCFLMV